MRPEKAILRPWVCALFLAALTFLLYSPVRTHDFVNYDDQLYITENPRVQQGLTGENIHWAFTRLTGNGTYWHPLTWLSHFADAQFFRTPEGKPAPGPAHLVSAGFHAVNAALVFLLLWQLTGAKGRSFVVAALFAWHPLQVDSVAWLAERKNVLSTLFWLLSLMVYTCYAKAARGETTSPRRWIWYALAWLLMALGLMCKPALVTLPCLLLLLDLWPLQRLAEGKEKFVWHLGRFGRLVLEKVPFFLLSLASGLITIAAHKQLALVTPTDRFSLADRLANAVVSYLRYARKACWPDDLAVYYPLPAAWPLWLVAGGTLFVGALLYFGFADLKKRPWLLVGGGWFLGTLFPFIGLLQVNDQAMADRFAYVPLIGFFVAAVWLAAAALEKWRMPAGVGGAVAGAVLLASAVVTSAQIGHWKNSETLFTHALRVTESNNVAHLNLGSALEIRGDLPGALDHYEESVRLVPNNSMAESNLGVVLAKMNRLEEAMPHFLKAKEINPDNPDARSNLGLAYSYQGKNDEALAELTAALKLKPAHLNALKNLGDLQFRRKEYAAAVEHYLTALALDPRNPEVEANVGYALDRLGRPAEAIPHYRAALALNPRHPQANYNLGVALAQGTEPAAAIPFFQTALASKPDFAEAHYQLGLLCRRLQQTADATTHLREALRLRPDWSPQITPLLGP